jgi:hypothetical protein
MPLAPLADMDQPVEWDSERQALLGRRISDLGLSIRGTRIERLVQQLYDELAAKGLAFRPPVYLSDEWGCPDATPLIGVPFYLADPRLERIEAEVAGGITSILSRVRMCGTSWAGTRRSILTRISRRASPSG